MRGIPWGASATCTAAKRRHQQDALSRKECPAGAPPWADAPKGSGMRRKQPFTFGDDATRRFFYTLEPHPAGGVLAAPAEFCLGAESSRTATIARACSSSRAWTSRPPEAPAGARAQPHRRRRERRRLMLAYGVNDCAGRRAGRGHTTRLAHAAALAAKPVARAVGKRARRRSSRMAPPPLPPPPRPRPVRRKRRPPAPACQDGASAASAASGADEKLGSLPVRPNSQRRRRVTITWPR